MITVTTEHRIPFHDIDVMHIAWHGHYFKYFELARTKLMQHIGLDWPYLKEQGIAMPIVDVAARYKNPLQYDDTFHIEATIHEWDYPELTVNYRILSHDQKRVAVLGHTRQIYYDIKSGSSLFDVPPIIKARFDEVRP